MAKSKKRAKSAGRRQSPGGRQAAKRPDAIALLTADHRQVEEWFEQFSSTGSEERKQRLVVQICRALKVHTQIEEEIFYPAFLEATGEEDVHHEAEIEHEGAKRLIADIEGSGPDDDYYDARVTVLSEMIKHHVNEEEKRGGMFAKARKANMDLAALGQQLETRKSELMSENAGDGESAVMGAQGREARVRA
ncbi:MAG: hemerythrin domain-containing protein [Sinobacteraceae bacterium]|nr:hemerythrin domain-containing protein [Nevskiaceae bacterium]